MDEKEYEVTITEVLEKKVRYRGRNELEATAKAKGACALMTHTPFCQQPLSGNCIVFVSQNLFYGQLPHRASFFVTI